MTSKEFVKKVLPKAKSEKHRTNEGKVYWLIRNGNDYMYIAEGKTESNAWVVACEKVAHFEVQKTLKALKSKQHCTLKQL